MLSIKYFLWRSTSAFRRDPQLRKRARNFGDVLCFQDDCFSLQVFLGKNYNGEKFNFNFSYNLSPCICLVSIFFELKHIENPLHDPHSPLRITTNQKISSIQPALPTAEFFLGISFCFGLDLYDDGDICKKKMLRISKFRVDLQRETKGFTYTNSRKEKYHNRDISHEPKSIENLLENF